MRRQRAAADVIGFGAGLMQLGVCTAVKVPVAFQLGAGGTSAEVLIDIVPFDVTMLLHVVKGNLIGDALVAQLCDQPIKHSRGVAVSYRCSNTIAIKVGANFVDQTCGPGETANAVDHPGCMIERG